MVSTEMSMDADGVMRMVRAMADAVTEQAVHLGHLDAISGDGDHGAGISRAMRTAASNLEAAPPSAPADALQRTGSVLMDEMGGAAGLLFGTIFTAAARRAGTAEQLDTRQWAAMITDAQDAVQKRGKAQPGDKTMVDALAPAAVAFREAAEQGLPLRDAFELSARAAAQGVEATKAMLPKQGRARFVGERSVGHADAGATSLSIMLGAAARSLTERSVA